MGTTNGGNKAENGSWDGMDTTAPSATSSTGRNMSTATAAAATTTTLTSNQTRAIDEMLCREMGRLSAEEKRNVEEEILGYYSKYPSVVEDCSTGVAAASGTGKRRSHYVQFQVELDLLPPRVKQSYLRARSIQAGIVSNDLGSNTSATTTTTTTTTNNNNNNNSSRSNCPTVTISSAMGGRDNVSSNTVFVLRDEYRLRFLRTTLFDVQKAALRYCKWLDLLVDYFGEIVLTRPPYLTDLDEASCRYLKEGRVQVLPSRDRSGRRILACLRHIGDGTALGFLSLVGIRPFFPFYRVYRVSRRIYFFLVFCRV
jgi:hypothetical protein